jgi:YggT family protein
MGIICFLLWAYFLVLLARVVFSWIPVPPRGAVTKIASVVYEITEPVLRPLRNLLPPLRMGAMGLDLSPIILFIVVQILIGVFC